VSTTALIQMRTFTVAATLTAIATAAVLIAGAQTLQDPLAAAILVKPASAAALREWDERIDGMRDAGALRLRQSQPDTLVPGVTHERFGQYYDGLPVFGADITRQLDPGAAAASVFGVIYPSVSLDTTPSVAEDEALAAVRDETGADSPVAGPAELLVLPVPAGFVLAWRIPATTPDRSADYFVDAHTGAVVLTLDRRETAAAVGSGAGVLGDVKKVSDDGVGAGFLARDLLRPPSIRTYDMRGNLPRVKAFLNRVVAITDGDLASTTSANQWSDPAIVDAHAHAGMVYDFYFKRFGRRGLDDRDLGIVSLVHPVLRTTFAAATPGDFGLFYLNAFWDELNRVMVYGDGLPPGFVTIPARQSWNYLSGALDVVGHELTHGVTQFTSGLVERNESGALNESFSDMMGTSAEFFYRTGSGAPQPDYLIGADVVRGPLNGLRSMASPRAFGDPDHYSRRRGDAADQGEVHANAGISNNAFYLAIEGGTNATSGARVEGVGPANREQIEKVFYRAFAFLMPSNATFAIARAATIQSARDLYGGGSAVELAVTQAWAAVGVQ
jgi:bacillolysin